MDVTHEPGPRVCVVLASVGASADLDAALTVLVPACREMGVDLIVVRAGTEAEVATLSRAHPAARFIVCEPGAGAAELRSAGLREANADVVLFTGELATMLQRWSDVLPRSKGAFGPGPSLDAPRDWAAWLAHSGVSAPSVVS